MEPEFTLFIRLAIVVSCIFMERTKNLNNEKSSMRLQVALGQFGVEGKIWAVVSFPRLA